jgi:hypothetical protein
MNWTIMLLADAYLLIAATIILSYFVIRDFLKKGF